jgi:probable F420-dependent oxidoreductase
MTTSRPFRFGVITERMPAPDAWAGHARRVERLGYATLLLRDHFVTEPFGDQYAPLVALAAAACATTRLRVGTLVLCNDYRHPVMLAKEAATLDALSGGRLELGLGAGWLREEYERAGMTYDPPGVRIARLAEAIEVLKALFAGAPATVAGTHYAVTELAAFPRPCQQPHPPILVGGGGRRILGLAGRVADTVGLLTTSVATGVVVDDGAERTAARVAEKIAWVREGAGARVADVELSLVASVSVTEARDDHARALIAERGWGGVGVEDVLDMPSVFIGGVDRIVDDMQARRDRFGISYYVVPDRLLETLAPVVARLAGR